jgi:O-phosphoseryl-tRNA(Cys) synthetase
MNIANCIFINSFEDEVKTLKVTHEDGKIEIVTLNLDDPVVSDIVKSAGGIEQIESNTRRFNKNLEREEALYKKFKKHMLVSDDLSFLFTKEFDQENLFNLKIWLFELPEVENSSNVELKKTLRTSKDLIEIVGTYYLMKLEANQNAY